MAITIGRVGASPTLEDPQSIDFDGERLRFSGLSRASSVANALVLRDQLRGLAANIDEPVVPILFTDSTYDQLEGLYRIDGVQARLNETDAALGDVSWQMQATRVANYQAPVIESRVVMTWLSNSHTIASTTARHEWGIPYISTEVYPQAGSTDGTGVLDLGDGGSLTYLHYLSVAAGGNPFSSGVGTWQWTTNLSTWYSGSCKITMDGNTVVGRQAVDTPTSWTMSNGMVRISASATAGAWDIEWWDGTQWDTAKAFRPFSFGNNVDGFWHVGILRNSPEATTIRLGLSNPTGYTVNADLTIRRGSRWVTVVFSGTSAQWGVRRTSAEASTAVTGGIRATSNDASGNRFLLASQNAFTQDLTNAAIWLTTGAERSIFGIGCEVGGSGASSPWTATAQIARFFGPVHETVRVVGR